MGMDGNGGRTVSLTAEMEIVATDLLVMSLYAAVGACSRHQGGRVAGQWLGRFCGLAMIGVAGSLALMRRAEV